MVSSHLCQSCLYSQLLKMINSVISNSISGSWLKFLMNLESWDSLETYFAVGGTEKIKQKCSNPDMCCVRTFFHNTLAHADVQVDRCFIRIQWRIPSGSIPEIVLNGSLAAAGVSHLVKWEYNPCLHFPSLHYLRKSHDLMWFLFHFKYIKGSCFGMHRYSNRL